MKKYMMTMFFAVCALCYTSTAWAHSALLNCFDNADNTFTCQGGFSDGSSATGIRIVLMDAGGTVLQEAQLNADSEIVLPYPRGDFKVLFDGGPGHSVEITGDVIVR